MIKIITTIITVQQQGSAVTDWWAGERSSLPASATSPLNPAFNLFPYFFPFSSLHFSVFFSLFPFPVVFSLFSLLTIPLKNLPLPASATSRLNPAFNLFPPLFFSLFLFFFSPHFSVCLLFHFYWFHSKNLPLPASATSHLNPAFNLSPPPCFYPFSCCFLSPCFRFVLSCLLFHF